MSQAETIIREEIKREGPISFERFMEMALYMPGCGYYMSERIPWGKKGDYYTAPHLHQVFGALIGIQLKELWEIMGRPKRFFVVEGGPGDGTLAHDVLHYLSGHEKEFFSCICYVLIEKNPYFEKMQRNKLKHFTSISWYRDISEMEEFSGVFFSNELFDAFPVRRVQMDTELKEIYVGLEGERFVEVRRDADDHLKAYFKDLSISLRKGFTTEVCLKLKDFLDDLSAKLVEGFVYTIDYGLTGKEYFSEERSKGTLICYFRHTFHENPHINIGKQDITAHVNFSALKMWGEEKNLKTLGFAPLGTYLVSLGMDRVILDIVPGKNGLVDSLKLKALLAPQGFGESHRVMIQVKGKHDFKLKGFSLTNMIGSL